jgi:hypothetical protein
MDKKSFMQSEEITGFIGLDLKVPYQCEKLFLQL